MDAEGTVVGTFRWVSHIVDAAPGAGEDIAINQNIYTLPNGTLHGDGQITFDTPLDPQTQPLSRSAIAVVGGTGAFVRSEGEVRATWEDGKPSRYTFELYCD